MEKYQLGENNIQPTKQGQDMDRKSIEPIMKIDVGKGSAPSHPRLHDVFPPSAQRTIIKDKGDTNKFSMERSRGKKEMGTGSLEYDL